MDVVLNITLLHYRNICWYTLWYDKYGVQGRIQFLIVTYMGGCNDYTWGYVNLTAINKSDIYMYQAITPPPYNSKRQELS